MSKVNRITDASHENFTMIPNIIDDLQLSVYAYRLYAHMKRRAGENGECYENTSNMAKHCKCSAGSVTNAKKELAEFGLIAIEKVEQGQGKYPYDNITILDIWQVNEFWFAKKNKKVRNHKDRKAVIEAIKPLILLTSEGMSLAEALDYLREKAK